MGAPDFFRIEDLNTRANLCEKYVLARIHQNLQWSHCNEIEFCANQM